MIRLALAALLPIGIVLAWLPTGCSPSNRTSSENRDLKPYAEEKLRSCLPKRWTVQKVAADSNKIALSHIGKATFELHFKAQYLVGDTLHARHLGRKPGNAYKPKIVLHFYRYTEKTKQEARFVQDNMAIISKITFPHDFGETQDFLVYESTGQVALPAGDSAEIRLRKCLMAKLHE